MEKEEHELRMKLQNLALKSTKEILKQSGIKIKNIDVLRLHECNLLYMNI